MTNENNKVAQLADGVYILGKDGSATLFDGKNTQLQGEPVAIGIKLGSRSLKLGLRENTDSAQGICTLTTKPGGSAARFKGYGVDATADWDGQGNTEDLREILNPAINLQAGEWVPSLGEMRFIQLHLKDVNAALELVHGDILEPYAWYWTSTSYSANYAWYLVLGNGYASHYTKATNQRRVRPVSAFLL